STNGTRVPIVPVAIGGVVILVGSYFGGVEAIGVATALTVIGTLIWRLAEGAEGFVRDMSAGIFVTTYVPVLGAFVLLMAREDDGPWRIVAFVGCTVASDTGGYIAGVIAGRHPMAPTISPKKSWEGFCGSLIAGMVAGALIIRYGLDGPWWVGIVLGVAVVIMATLGDLSESLVKRDLGIKDMGNLLPGHGGIMDRLDSLLAVAPICWLILHLLVEA
ncbi:MAG: phosphatidate cytidylyltransferase, partial [Nocardioidaceae bacterium]